MNRRRVRRAARAAGVALVLVVAAGCGAEDTGGAIGTGTNTTAPAVDVALVVDVASDGTNSTKHASITCQGGLAYGTGYLLEPSAAFAACALVRRDPAVQKRLTSGRPDDQVCTQEYGGPQVATITGSVMGQPVDTRVDRADGCGIADWDLLQPLVGSAE